MSLPESAGCNRSYTLELLLAAGGEAAAPVPEEFEDSDGAEAGADAGLAALSLEAASGLPLSAVTGSSLACALFFAPLEPLRKSVTYQPEPFN